ncbi:unnamed protein product [Lampetra planeri]
MRDVAGRSHDPPRVGGHAMRPHCGSKTGPAYASQWGSGLATWGGGGYQLPRLHHAAHSPCLPSHTAYTYALAVRLRDGAHRVFQGFCHVLSTFTSRWSRELSVRCVPTTAGENGGSQGVSEL